MNLKGRIGVITGASAGIGTSLARSFVNEGCPVVLNARRKHKLDELLGALGTEDASVIAGDCADDAIIAAMLDAAKSEFGGGEREADLVVVNAGRGLKGSVIDSDLAQWEELVRTNVLAAARLIRAAGTRMLASIDRMKSRGKSWDTHAHDIVVLGSTVGRHISPFSSMYGSTKFAVNAMAEAVRRELGPKGIRVTLIEPGFVESEFQGVAGYDPEWFASVKDRIGPVLTPDDVAGLVTSIVSLPARVHVSDALIRPTRQDYP
jgi:NADP-dependent 3-hydroxy acid dehydrogenase YdfG